MRRRKTHREFVEEVIEIRGDIYEFLTEYESSLKKVEIKHVLCGHQWSVNPSSLIKKEEKGRLYCPKCNGGVGHSLSIFKQKVYELTNDEYIVLGDYKNSQTPISMKHNDDNCLHEYTVRPGDFINDHNRCPKCAKKSKKTTDDFKREVSDREGDKYLVVGEYVNGNTLITLKHNEDHCKRQFDMFPINFLFSDLRCPLCFKDAVTHKDNFNQKLFDKYGDEYLALDEYSYSKVEIRFKHNTEECGKIFHRSPNHFMNEDRLCPCLNTHSKGEQKISEWLNSQGVNHKEQYTFENCRIKYRLKFDFAIFNNQNELLYLIEYDGEQHFEPIKHFGGVDNLIETQTRDNVKNTYCKENNISLFRIPHWKYDDLENVLNKIINNEHIEIDEATYLIL